MVPHATPMLLIPVNTRLLSPGDDLASVILNGAKHDVRPYDIIVVSSKVVATAEGNLIDLGNQKPNNQTTRQLSREIGRSEEFCQAMLHECDRLHGKIVNTCPGAALTELRPDGLASGTILVANAGLDESNAPKNFAIGWPKDPVASVRKLRKGLTEKMGKWANGHPAIRPSGHPTDCAIILTDSFCTPRRNGVTAFAMTVSGMNPLQSQKGRKDLFGKELKITTEAVADQLATAANFLMGNAGQSVPAVLIRDHGLTLSDWEGWVPGIEPEHDIFRSIV